MAYSRIMAPIPGYNQFQLDEISKYNDSYNILIKLSGLRKKDVQEFSIYVLSERFHQMALDEFTKELSDMDEIKRGLIRKYFKDFPGNGESVLRKYP